MDMADWMSVKSISDKYGISESRVLGWIRECEITSSTVGSVVLIDDECAEIDRKREAVGAPDH